MTLARNEQMNSKWDAGGCDIGRGRAMGARGEPESPESLRELFLKLKAVILITERNNSDSRLCLK